MADSSATPTCALCGGPLDEYDFDRGTCHDCRAPEGKLAELDIAVRAARGRPDRIRLREWPVIRHLLRQRFGENRLDDKLWERCTDWLCAEGGLKPNDYLAMPLDCLPWLLDNGFLGGDQTGPWKMLEAFRAVECELENWNRSDFLNDTGELIGDVPARNPLRSAVAALHQHYGGSLPKPARSHWRNFLRLARRGDEGAKDEADKLLVWVNGEIRLLVASDEGAKADEEPALPAERTSRSERRALWLAKAMLLVHDNPEWSDAAIARLVKMAPSTLSRSPEYQAAAAMARGDKSDLCRGHVTVDPESGLRDVEAYSEDSAECDLDE